MDFTAQLNAYHEAIERGLEQLAPAGDTRPARLHEAMRYSLQAGGKRLRPMLVLAAAELIAGRAVDGLANDGGGAGRLANPVAAAVALECIHTYSLIHDDLPCMDNDDLRRGRPALHKQFDEATALLAGDALLTLAFQLVGHHYAAIPPLCAALVREFADAAGSVRLIGGQMEDLLAEKKPAATAADLEFIHLNKTAAMISVALVAGGLCAGASETQLSALRTVGRELGLAFQIVDDILDATADTFTLGKTAGKDARAGKVTFVKIYGLASSLRHAREHTNEALTALRTLPGDAHFLTALVETMVSRTK